MTSTSARQVPALAERLDHIAPFYVMELVKRADALQRQGAPIIHLSIGEPDFTAPEPVVNALNKVARSGKTQYTSAMGIAPLREAIAGFYHDHWDVTVDPNRILVTAGASGALTLACGALVNPGDGVLLSDPGYPCNKHFVAAFNGDPQLVQCDASARFQMTADLVAAHWQANTRGLLVSTPSNPTGTSISPAELQRIVSAVRERNGFSIIDEIYLGLSYDNDLSSALAFADDIIVVNSFSKYFHMTGWRLGWLVIPEELTAGFERLAQNLVICPSSLAQQAAVACFSPESLAIYRERHAAFRERRDYMAGALQQIGLDVPVAPDGAFYFYVDVSRYTNDSMAFAIDVLEKAHVAVVPGIDFSPANANRYIRIGYANSPENLREAVNRLGNYLATYG